jgi:hypothetical protein
LRSLNDSNSIEKSGRGGRGGRGNPASHLSNRLHQADTCDAVLHATLLPKVLTIVFQLALISSGRGHYERGEKRKSLSGFAAFADTKAGEYCWHIQEAKSYAIQFGRFEWLVDRAF